MLPEFGVISEGAAAEITIPITVTWEEFKWVGSEVGSVLAVAIEHDLRVSYFQMDEAAADLAQAVVRTERLRGVTAKATAEQRAGFESELSTSIRNLQEALNAAAVTWWRVPQPPLAKRYQDSGVPPLMEGAMKPSPDVGLVLGASHLLLDAMTETVRDFNLILREVYEENGFKIPEEAAKSGKEGKTEPPGAGAR